MAFKTDIEIAREARKRPIMEIGAKLGIPAEHLLPYGHDKAKIGQEFIKSLEGRPDGKLILVTAINPTPAGEGKTTTTVGLGDGLNRIGKKAVVCIREASLGPNFGMKGGAAGGGYAQVVPMEEMNLHFTGDFHAITSAHNLLSAMIDNHIYWGNSLDIDERRIVWRRVMDMNDRALRDIVVSLGGVSNGFPRQTGFDITVASEVMAILCLSNDLEDLQKRLGDIVVAYTREKKPVYCRDLKADGAMTGFAYPEMMVDVVRHTNAGEAERAQDLFDAYLPLARFEQQPGIGLAVRKYTMAKRGIIAHASLRRPGAGLNERTIAEVDRLIRRQESRLKELN